MNSANSSFYKKQMNRDAFTKTDIFHN